MQTRLMLGDLSLLEPETPQELTLRENAGRWLCHGCGTMSEAWSNRDIPRHAPQPLPACTGHAAPVGNQALVWSLLTEVADVASYLRIKAGPGGGKSGLSQRPARTPLHQDHHGRVCTSLSWHEHSGGESPDAATVCNPRATAIRSELWVVQGGQRSALEIRGYFSHHLI